MADATKNLQIILSAKDEASGVIGKMSNSFKSFTNNAKLGSAMIAGSIGLLSRSIINVGADYEQARVSFETMLGSAEKGGKMLKELADFAVRTPFDLPQVVEGGKRLLAYGIEADKIIPTFTLLGNIAAGVGTDKLPQLTLAFGQVRAATFLTGAELRQFTEAGVPLLDELAKQSGKTAGQIKESMEDGARIPFAQVEKALQSLTGEGGRFFNLMERQSKTFSGTMSNVRDSFVRFSLDVLGINENGDIRNGSVFYFLKLGADGLKVKLEELRPTLQGIVDTLLNNGPALIGVVTALVVILTPLIAGFIASVAPILLLSAAIGGLAWGIGELIEYFYGPDGLRIVMEGIANFVKSEIQPRFERFQRFLKDDLNPIIDKLSIYFKVMGGIMMDIIKPAFDMAKERVIALIDRVKQMNIDWEKVIQVVGVGVAIVLVAIAGIIMAVLGVLAALAVLIEKVVIPAIQWMIDINKKASDSFMSMITWIKDTYNWLSKLTSKNWNIGVSQSKSVSRQHGGFVNAPYGQAVPAVLHGGERVVPRNGIDVNGGMGTGTVNINFTGAVKLDSETRVQELADRITRILGRQNELARYGVAV